MFCPQSVKALGTFFFIAKALALPAARSPALFFPPFTSKEKFAWVAI